MSEAHRYYVVRMLSEGGNRISYDPKGPEVVLATSFDRVVAERDALQQSQTEWMRIYNFTSEALCEIGEILCVDAEDQSTPAVIEAVKALQQRLTAADERADVLVGLVGEVLDAVGREPLDLDAVLRMRARMRAALKPAEGGGDDSERN